MQDFRPYQPPGTEPEPPSERGVLARHRRVSVSQALSWIPAGWRMMPGNWGVVLGVLVTIVMINLALGFVPVLGDLVLFLIMPLLYAGLVQVAHNIQCDKVPTFTDLFSGFNYRAKSLMLSALAQAGVIIAMTLVFAGLLFALAGGVGMENLDASMPLMWVLGALLVVALMVLTFMFYFVVPLIYLGERSVMDAIAGSFYACLENIVPMVLYGLCVMGLLLIGFLTLGIGLLVVMPVLMMAYYQAFRSLFMTEESTSQDENLSLF